MSTELQILLGICASLITVLTVIVIVGRWSGSHDSRIDSLEHEVKRLRDWRHSGVNFQASVEALQHLTTEVNQMMAEMRRMLGRGPDRR
jgi:hypothetical protein